MKHDQNLFISDTRKAKIRDFIYAAIIGFCFGLCLFGAGVATMLHR